MAKMLYSFSMSVDGFLAGPGGDMSWLTPYFEPNTEIDELLPQIGSLLIGRNTFGGDDPNRGTDAEGPFGGRWSGAQFVLTHEPPAEAVPGVSFLTDLAAAIAAAKEAAGERYVNILGADIARQCLEVGELDEVLVFVAPLFLGDGVRVFDHPGGSNIRLERLRVSAEAQLSTMLWYRVA